MEKDQIEQFIRCYRDNLLDEVLPFWMEHGVDQDLGGIITSLDRSGTVIDDDKGVWQQGRFTWLLGELFNHRLLQDHPQRQSWLETAERNLSFMSRFCFDTEDGRMWFHLTREGKPIRKRRYAFSESFAAIAYGEWAQATGSEEYAQQAEACFEAFVTQSTSEPDHPKFTDNRPSKGIGFSMIAIVTAQQLRDSIQLETADAWIDRYIAEIQRDFCKPDLECVMENVGLQGEVLEHFDGRTLNPGHAMEAAWFIMSEGVHRQDTALQDLGCQMLDWMWQRGWDKEHGGLLYFTSLDGKPIQEYWQDMKFWWPHNEAIIATLMAWKITGDEKYATWHRQIHEWSHNHFHDVEYGEWFGYLRRDGQVVTPLKGNLWKGPFHLPRMQLIAWDLLETLPSERVMH